MARQSLSPGHRDRRIIAIIQASHGTGAIFFAVTMLCKLRILRRQPAWWHCAEGLSSTCRLGRLQGVV